MSKIPKKRLEGVSLGSDLQSLLDHCVSVCNKPEQQPVLTAASSADSASDIGSIVASPSRATPSSRVVKALSTLPQDEARTTILEFHDDKKANKKADGGNDKVLPISVVRAMQALLSDGLGDVVKAKELEVALMNTKLVFTKTEALDGPETRDQKRFRARMDRLRLQNEETRYMSLTKNIQAKSTKDDEITTKSMTYAASIGLNMIVAPLSFGCFMYFFAGAALNFFWDKTEELNRRGNPVDVRKVIIGVVSGVLMLFIEMLLFVIRTHEFDRGLRRKEKKNAKKSKVKPFGEYSSANEKTFESKE